MYREVGKLLASHMKMKRDRVSAIMVSLSGDQEQKTEVHRPESVEERERELR